MTETKTTTGTVQPRPRPCPHGELTETCPICESIRDLLATGGVPY